MISRDKQFYARFFSLMVPLALQSVIIFSVSLMDNVMISFIGDDPYALPGVGVSNQVQFVLQMLTAGVSSSVIILGTQYWGQKRVEDLKSIIGVGVKVQAALGLLFFLTIFLFSGQVMRAFTNDPMVIERSTVYLRIVCFTYFFSCMTSILLACMQCVETVRIGFLVTLVSLAVNVSGNYILIFGNLGAPRLGLRGAAVATLLARIVEFCIALGYVLLADRKLRLKLRELVRMDFSFFGDYLRCGLPVIVANFLWALAVSSQVAILGRLPQLQGEVLAANTVATDVFQIFSVANGAMGSAAVIIIGKAVGEGDREKIKLYSRSLQVVFLCIGIVVGLALYLCKGLVLSVYDTTPEVYALANSFLTVLSVTLVGTCYQAPTLTGIVRGGGDTKFVLYNDLIFQFGIVVPSAALAAFVFHLAPVYVYMFLKSDQITKCIVAVIKVNRYRWIKVLTRERKEEGSGDSATVS